MKAVLNVIKNLSRRIEDAETKLNYLKNLVKSFTSKLDGMPKAPNVSKKVEFLAVGIADLASEIYQLNVVRIECQLELSDLLLEKIKDIDICRIIFLRYGQLKRFSEIAAEVNFAESTVFRLHRLGLRMLGINPKASDDYEFDS